MSKLTDAYFELRLTATAFAKSNTSSRLENYENSYEVDIKQKLEKLENARNGVRQAMAELTIKFNNEWVVSELVKTRMNIEKFLSDFDTQHKNLIPDVEFFKKSYHDWMLFMDNRTIAK